VSRRPEFNDQPSKKDLQCRSVTYSNKESEFMLEEKKNSTQISVRNKRV
jgi:hypothetical protein